MNEIKFIDLFGGVGGFSLGLERANNQKGEYLPKWRRSRPSSERQGNIPNSKTREAGGNGSSSYRCVGYYEIDKYAVQTYNKNFGTQHRPTDITKLKESEIPPHDLICAGFPCQSFSIAGKRRGFKDTRGTLFFEICRIAKHHRTPYLLLENVKGLLNHDEGDTFETILRTLDELGYYAEWQVLNSKNFGVPQNRERVFIIGHLRGEPRPKVFPITEGDTGNNETQREAQREGAWIRNNHPQYANTLSKGYYKGGCGHQMIHNVYGGFNEGIREFEDCSPTIRTPKGGGHLPMVAQAIQTDGYLRQGSSFGTDKPQSARNIRRLTPIECERLQGFPDNWTAGVSDTQRYKQMGNAVTVNVIEAIGRGWLNGG